jgi:hypothetical protein
MKTLIASTVGLLALTTIALSGARSEPGGDAAEVGSKIPAFTATAVATVDSHATAVPTVYMIVGVRCGATPGYEERFKELETRFRSKGVDFVWVFPNSTESHDDKAGWMKKLGLRGGMVEDAGAAITKSLGCRQTAQAIFAAADGKILFRGGIDDSKKASGVTKHYLADAITAHLDGKPVEVSEARAFG